MSSTSVLNMYLVFICACIFILCHYPLHRANPPAIITSTTIEVVVPRSVVPAIYGEDGGCLRQIREVYYFDLVTFEMIYNLAELLLTVALGLNMQLCISKFSF